jgi:hypothetical protein
LEANSLFLPYLKCEFWIILQGQKLLFCYFPGNLGFLNATISWITKWTVVFRLRIWIIALTFGLFIYRIAAFFIWLHFFGVDLIFNWTILVILNRINYRNGRKSIIRCIIWWKIRKIVIISILSRLIVFWIFCCLISLLWLIDLFTRTRKTFITLIRRRVHNNMIFLT